MVAARGYCSLSALGIQLSLWHANGGRLQALWHETQAGEVQLSGVQGPDKLGMMTVVAIAAAVWFFACFLKWTFWSGTYPPDAGWSKRQMDRMDRGKSPWTFWCAVTYPLDRYREINRERP